MLISLQDTGFLSKACRAIKNLSAQHRHISHYEHIQTEQRSWNPQNSTIKLAFHQTCQSSRKKATAVAGTGDDADT